MKQILTLILVALAVLPACKSKPQAAEKYDQVMKEAPDAKPALYVSSADERYVEEGKASGRQIHLYSKQKNKTYVVDEKTGEVVRTFDSKTPSVVVVEPRGTVGESGAAAPEGCGCGAAPEGCGCAPEESMEDEGCAADSDEGCEADEGCEDGCGQ
jgi:hypothetical protein